MPGGIINVYKPQGPTSFDVVAAVRRALGTKRVGHLGTLDPMAEGVLPVAAGSAARVMEYLDGDTKEYLARVRLGFETDTQDVTGKVIARADEVDVTDEQVREALAEFEGEYFQVPPAYSALKLNGKKLYEYARKGMAPEIEPRRVFVESVRNVCFDGEKREVSFLAAVSKGTYIRTLAKDLGDKLGCGACLAALERRRSGSFRAEDAVRLDDLKEMSPEEIRGIMRGPDSALAAFGSVSLGEWESTLFRRGVRLRAGQWTAAQGEGFPEWLSEETAGRYEKLFRVYGSDGAFLGVGEAEEEGTLRTDKVFV